MNQEPSKPVVWIGTAYEDWLALPDNVQDVMGYAVHLAQCGEKAGNAKPLSGFKGAAVLEITDDFDGDIYRAVYTVKFKGVVYV
ncbi:MAG: type II toxin-antitoxin system RelE/ParE family toxin, partial [Methylococcales bacterium]